MDKEAPDTIVDVYIRDPLGATSSSDPIISLHGFINAKKDEMDNEDLIALARYFKSEKRYSEYRYILQLIDREDIFSVLKEQTIAQTGIQIAEEIFHTIDLPEAGAAPEAMAVITAAFVRKLNSRFNPDFVRRILTGNVHRIPEDAFEKEADVYRKSDSLMSYLEESHQRSVSVLASHAASGDIWFEQEIDDSVVDYVRSNPEILGGVLKERKIYITKIPYDPGNWLKEDNPEKKRYLYCHCPMARAALKNPGMKIDREWCYCSAGFAKLKYDVLFGEVTEVELLESVLAGDDLCRFAVTVPSGTPLTSAGPEDTSTGNDPINEKGHI